MKKLHFIHNIQNGLNYIQYTKSLHHTYRLLYCKGHIGMITNDSTINVISRNNRVNKMTKLHLIHLEFLHYNI